MIRHSRASLTKLTPNSFSASVGFSEKKYYPF